MTRRRRLASQLPLLAWLTVVWVALWGSLTAANVLGGLAVGLVVLVALPLPEVPTRGKLRPLALARLLAVFAYELVTASLTVVRQVLDPRASLRQAVVAVPVVATSDQLLTLLADAVSLTPGTLALEVDRPAGVLYVHVLDLGGADGAAEDVRRSIMRLERLVLEALGPAEQVQQAREAERAAARRVRS